MHDLMAAVQTSDSVDTIRRVKSFGVRVADRCSQIIGRSLALRSAAQTSEHSQHARCRMASDVFEELLVRFGYEDFVIEA